MTSTQVALDDCAALDALVYGNCVELVVVAVGDDRSQPRAAALATFHRARLDENEALWAQLVVDGDFVDVVRAIHVNVERRFGSSDEVSFVARFAIPDLYLDGRVHRAQVRFVPSVSRVVPRGTGDQMARTETRIVAAVDAEFTACLFRRRARVLV